MTAITAVADPSSVRHPFSTLGNVARRNPPVVPADTTRDVWRRQMAAIGARTPQERIVEWEQLNRAAAKMEADAVRRRHPEYTERQVVIATMRLRYGDDLVTAACPDEPLVEP